MNVLEISQAEWQMVPGPSNVLVLPQKVAPTNPMFPTPTELIAFQYNQGPCPGGFCTLLFHDASSGWWIPQFSTDCNGGIGWDGIFYTVEQWARKLVETGFDPFTNQPFTPACGLKNIPWAQP